MRFERTENLTTLRVLGVWLHLIGLWAREIEVTFELLSVSRYDGLFGIRRTTLLFRPTRRQQRFRRVVSMGIKFSLVIY